ncbi:hypothetical protein C0991_009951 [Blastosporella zonata]|nr:hypothetical protein C0991_009951 [Blastosporella zonata]
MKDTPQKPRMTPHTSAGFTQDQSRRRIHDYMNDHLVSCPVSSWFNHYPGSLKPGLAFGSKSMKKLVQDVKDSIPEHLNKNGWMEIQKRSRGNSSELEIFDPLVDIADACGKAAKLNKDIVPRSQLYNSGNARMLLEVESYQFRPDFRSFPKENFVQEVFYGPSSRGPISQAEYEGIIKRGAASTVLGEVKRKDGVRERSDVPISLSS